MIKKNISAALLLSLLLITGPAHAQTVLPLYKTIPNSIPSAMIEKRDTVKPMRIRVSNVSVPTLTVYLPQNNAAGRTAVVICPGGGYSNLIINQEGTEIAEAFNKRGIAAFVLKYRLPENKIMTDKEIGPLQDAQQAIKMVRENAKQWNIDTNKVGIIGFSAGGHLAATASTKFARQTIDNPTHVSLRPDFTILAYPVVSFTDSLLHKGSRNRLVGEQAPPEKIIEYSAEKQVTAATPPALIMHCGDDKVVPVANSIEYYKALQQHGVKAELHIYPSGGHGFGLHNPSISTQWIDRCFSWMEENKWL
jgi:acetyl esterase/lipase